MRFLSPIRNQRCANTSRVFDICAVVALAPILILLTVALGLIIVVIDQYPPFYQSIRPGKGGQPFTCYKLQTLNPWLKIDEVDRAWIASRVTRLGFFLRNHGLDEIPQAWNVLCGEMSLIGPRPMPTAHLDLIMSRSNYEEAAAWLSARSTVRPGITGWVHINQLDTFEDRTFELDMEYLAKPNIGKKIVIFIGTTLILVIGKSLYFKLVRRVRGAAHAAVE